MKKTILILVAVLTGYLAASASLPDNGPDYSLRDAATTLRGDVNRDGNVNITDVTMLINYLLSLDPSGIDLSAADCRPDGGVNISDVTTLINYLLSHAWPTEEIIYRLEKLWEVSDLSFMNTIDVRQGFGMNGKFYINDKYAKQILVIDEHGLTNTTYPGGANCAITRDEAGNLIVSNTEFPYPWENATIKVINPNTNEVKTYTVPQKCGMSGRCDYLGHAQGNLMQEGSIAFSGDLSTGISVLAIFGGNVYLDGCYNMPTDSPAYSATSFIDYYTDLAGQEALLYVHRQHPPLKITFDGSYIVATTISLPNKGFICGTFPFIWDGKELFLYPTLPNYQNAFAVAEAGAEEPIVIQASTVTANANSFQADWLNAEVISENEVLIYQYYPGGNITVYRLTKS